MILSLCGERLNHVADGFGCGRACSDVSLGFTARGFVCVAVTLRGSSFSTNTSALLRLKQALGRQWTCEIKVACKDPLTRMMVWDLAVQAEKSHSDSLCAMYMVIKW